MAFCPEHPKWDQNRKFTPLSETTSIPAFFIWESPSGEQTHTPGTSPIKKMRGPFSDKWHLPFCKYWYFFLEPKTGTGLNCAIYKIPVNFSLSLDLTPGTGNPNKWYRKFRSFRWQREKGNTSKGITFFPEKVHQGEPFPLNSPQNFQVFHTNGKRSRFHKHNRRPHVMNMYLRHYWLHNGFASFGWKACLSSRAPKHRFV